MATCRIEWRTSAVRELRKLDRQVVPQIIHAIGALALDPLPRRCRKLRSGERTYRIRVGDYRVVYEFFEKESIVEISRVRHRRESYRT